MAKKRKKVKTRRRKKEGEGVTKAVLKGIVPGIGGLVERLEESSEVFRERLKEVDREVERELREQPLKRAKPKMKAGYRIRTIRKGKEPKRPRMIKKREKAELERLKERELLIDVFDERNKIRIIVELPGIKEKDVKLKLRRNELTISAGKYHKKVKLPHGVKKKISKTFKHGILEVKLDKKKI